MLLTNWHTPLIQAFRMIVKYRYDRMPLQKSILHRLLHLADTAYFMGPCRNFWAYSLEKRISGIRSQIHSAKHPYTNLSNRLCALEGLQNIYYRSSEDLRLNLHPLPPPTNGMVPLDARGFELHGPRSFQALTADELTAVLPVYRQRYGVDKGIFACIFSGHLSASYTVVDSNYCRRLYVSSSDMITDRPLKDKSCDGAS